MTSILIVEDEALIASDLQMRLENMGYSVVGVAATGKEALKLIAEKRPDLVLMDIVLRGEMDGVDVARRVKELRVPVVLLTAYSDPETIGRARRAGAYGYLLKPYDYRTLRVTIETALKRYRADIRDLLKVLGERETPAIPGVLVVEDEAIVAADLSHKLEEAGFRVLGVEDTGEGAVSAAAELQPDVVIMDVYLKGEMDGIEAAEMIQGEHGIPVIYLTAYSDDSTLARILETEPYGYLLKPFSTEQLRAEIEVVLQTIGDTEDYSRRMHEVIVTKAEEMKIEKTGVFFVSSLILGLAAYGFITRSMTWFMYTLFIPVVYSLLHLTFSFSEPERPDTDSMPMVSIIVPAHNEENTIERCVETLSSLDYHINGKRNYEIIVVNDGSTDRTGEILGELVRKYRHLKVVTRRAPFAFNGKGYALNDGVTLADGDIIAVFDADARVEPDFLRNIVPYLDGEGVAGAQSRVRMYNADENLLTKMQDLEFVIFGNVIMRSRMNMDVLPSLGVTASWLRGGLLRR